MYFQNVRVIGFSEGLCNQIRKGSLTFWNRENLVRVHEHAVKYMLQFL